MADGLTYHPNTSDVEVQTMSYDENPGHEVQFCCPSSLVGFAQIEMKGEVVHVCLNCNAGYTTSRNLVAQYRVEVNEYHDPILHRVQSFKADEPLDDNELAELRLLLSMHPRRRRSQVKLLFLARREIVAKLDDVA
jgi:hypothetical protein